MKIWVHAPALRDRSVWDAISPFIETSICDVGCGRGKFRFYIEFAQRGMKDKGFKVGVDLYLPYLKFAKHHRIYDLLIRADVTPLPFKHESFDCVVTSDVIEHLSKEDEYKMVDDIENIACKCIVISSPARLFHQEAHHENILQKSLKRDSQDSRYSMECG